MTKILLSRRLVLNPYQHGVNIVDSIKQAGYSLAATPAEADYMLMMYQTDYAEHSYQNTKVNNKFYDSRFIDLLDKSKVNTVLESLNVPTLKTKQITSVADIESFDEPNVVLKPSIGAGSTSPIPFAYNVMPKVDLISKLNEYFVKDLSGYIVQEGVTNNTPIIWVGGFVNTQGVVKVDLVMDQSFNQDPRFFENRNDYPYRWLADFHSVASLNVNHTNAINQIKSLFSSLNVKSTPFCIQSIIDDHGDVNILDFNFGIGKALLSIHRNDQTYIPQKLNYMYNDVDYTTSQKHYKFQTVDFPNGITDSIYSYMASNEIYFQPVVRTNTDFGTNLRNYQKKVMVHILRDTKEEVETAILDLKQFIQTA